MTDIADKFKDELKKSKSKKSVDLLILINKVPETYSICSDDGTTKIMVPLGNNQNLMGQLKNYFNNFKNGHEQKYDFAEMYGLIQTNLTAKEATSLYENKKFKRKITLLPGDLAVTLKP
jgi:hypothetical protein